MCVLAQAPRAPGLGPPGVASAGGRAAARRGVRVAVGWALLLGVGGALAGPPSVAPVERGLICARGEAIGGAIVEEVLQHAEFERCVLRLPEGLALTVELVGGAGSGVGACDAQGYALQPRWELLGRAVEREAQPPAVQALCARLAALPAYVPPAAPAGPAARPVEAPSAAEPGRAPPPALRPVVAAPRRVRAMPALFGLAALLLLAAAPGLAPAGGRRRWAAVGALAIGGLAAAAAPGGLLVGPDGGYIPLAQALGVVQSPRLYGLGWGGLMTAVAAGDPLRVFAFNRLIAPLWPLLALLGAAAAAPQLRALPLLLLAAGAALSLAYLRLIGAEAPHLLLLLLGAAALALLLRAQRRPWGLGAAAAGLLCGLGPHLRPEALLLPALPVFALCFASRTARWSLLWAIPGAGLGLSRAVELLGGPAVSGAVRPAHLLDPALLRWVAGDGVALPLGLAGLCLWGAGGAGARGGPGAAARLGLAALALSFGPVASKWWPLADGWRLHLPSFAPTVLLAALGAQRLGGLRPLRWLGGRLGGPGLLLGLAALSGLGALPAARAPWAPRAELDALARSARSLPPGATLLLADDTPNAADQRAVAAALGRAGGLRAAPMSAGPGLAPGAGGLYAFFGLRCAAGYPELPEGPLPGVDPCAALRAACRLRLQRRWPLPAVADLDLHWPPGPHFIELHAVEGCDAPPSPE